MCIKRILILSLFIVLNLSDLSAQIAKDSLEFYSYDERKTYEIGGITVLGAPNRDRNAIISISGLKVGSQLSIPGDDIPLAVKALWKLRLFEDVQIRQEKLVDDIIFLEIYLKERPTLTRYSYRGVKKGEHDDLNDELSGILTKGGIVTDDVKNNCIRKLKDYFIGKGYLDTKVTVQEFDEKTKENSTRLVFNIKTGEKVKINDIVFSGNTAFNDRKLRKQMEETKRQKAIFKKSKFVESDYEADKQAIITHYNNHGYRDAKIAQDTVIRRRDGKLDIAMKIDEGQRYFFRDISWKGNSVYTDNQLTTILGILPGDVYNPEQLERRLRFSFDGRDISSLYLDDGYLFFQVDATEVAVEGKYIDIEMRIYEGAQAKINEVKIVGNDRTHEEVIRRAVRTKPGSNFSRSQIIRSQRELINLGYFNPETMDVQPQPNPANGTVDILYKVEEQPSDQLELSAGYGGASGLIGTLGVTFNNFSFRNIKDRSTWSPLPQGDGQTLSLRAQSNSRFFRSYNFSFTEPWLGGKRPTSFTVGAVNSTFDSSAFGLGSLSITRGFIGLGTQLKWPDDFFSSSTTLTVENIVMEDYAQGQFFVNGDAILTGNFKNISIRQVFSRSSVAEPIFPRRGSRISLTMQFTPPYSLFRRDNEGFATLSEEEIADVERVLRATQGPGNPPSQADIDRALRTAESAKKFNFLEYHKWRVDGEWYFNLVQNLVVATSAKIGWVGSYNDAIGLTPFERFEIGGDGLSNQNAGITGKDIISSRGYEVQEFEQNLNGNGGATVFSKYTMELRYPLSTNPSSTIYATAFAQAANSWGEFEDFNPFELKRSVGVGMRVFLPVFGLLGFDYGWGLDRLDGTTGGVFNIVLGFEPD